MRRTPVLLSLLAAGAVVVAGCGDSSDSTTSSPPPTTAGTAPTSSAAHDASAAPSGSAAPSAGSTPVASNVVGEVTLVGGKPQGGAKRISIKAGQPAVLTVTSDQATEVHVHGADRTVEVPANQATSVDVSQAAPGSYEVEDHGSDALLAQLRVS